jgi:virulence-associated protein VagC
VEFSYKGYTVVARSEQQPDSRWLPVAELEIYHQGSTTTKPPLRAQADETRLTQSEADEDARRMAEAWIDLHG